MSLIDDLNNFGAETVQKPAPLPMPELKDVTQEVQPMNPQWARFRDQFAEAMKDSFYSIEGLERSIGQGKSIFFPGVKSAIVGERQVYEGGKVVFQVTWAIGDLEELKNLSYGVESVARLLGCTEMLIEGRAGWQKELKALGYAPFSVTVRKPL
jgi:hypothetical protein